MDSFLLARAITRQNAKTFYFASRFLKNDKRNAAYVIYAVCRISDEAVDNVGGGSPRHRLEKLEKAIAAAFDRTAPDNGILSAFRQTVQKYEIPKQYFSDLIAGMYLDLRKSRYRNFAELHDYCYKVAGVVGLIMLRIFGCNDQRAKNHAVDLGIAMQLTNILRDVGEDFGRGRIYLPEDEMARFGVTETDISESRIGDNLRALLKFQIARARRYYADSKPGIRMIGDLNSRFVVCVMADIYAGILASIEKNDYDIFSRRAHVGLLGKAAAVSKVILKGDYR